jgi:hypothetical protein
VLRFSGSSLFTAEYHFFGAGRLRTIKPFSVSMKVVPVSNRASAPASLDAAHCRCASTRVDEALTAAVLVIAVVLTAAAELLGSACAAEAAIPYPASIIDPKRLKNGVGLCIEVLSLGARSNTEGLY